MNHQSFPLMLLAFAVLSGCGGTASNPATTTTPTSPTTPVVANAVSISGINLMRNGSIWNPHSVQLIAFVAPPAAQTSYFSAAYAHYSNAELTAIQAWGADSIRLQVSQPGADPQNSLYSTTFVASVQSAVTFARSLGLNVILCVQDEAQSGELTPATLPNASTVRAWQTLAPLFNADTGILYETMNEPSLTPGTANWAAWQTAQNTVIAAIRATGSKNVVIADGLSYAEVLNGAPALTDSLNQVAYAAHPYFQSSFTAASFATNFGNYAAGAPVIVTEWSTLTSGYCDSNSPALALSLMQYLQSKNIGMNGYSYDNPGLAGSNFGTEGSIVQDFNGTPSTFANSIQCGTIGFGPGKLLQTWYKTGTVPSTLQ